MVDGDEEGITPVVEKALTSKSPMEVINDALIAGMSEVSRLWDEGIYFLPQVILASDQWGQMEKIVVLVNEFGEVGIDGDLLTGQGGDVVEMPSGCICCTIKSDFRGQMIEIGRRFHPDRVIVEPTGVATIHQIRTIFEARLFEETIQTIHYILIADAVDFMRLYKANRHFLESQVENAHLVILNKCDQVETRPAGLTRAAISAINPEIPILMAEFGAVDWLEYQSSLPMSHISETNGSEGKSALVNGTETLSPTVEHLHDRFEENGLGYESYGCEYPQIFFDRTALERFFQGLGSTEMGEVVRAKGVFRMGDKWILMELASGELSCQPVRPLERSKISIIGKGLDREKISASLRRCVKGAIFQG